MRIYFSFLFLYIYDINFNLNSYITYVCFKNLREIRLFKRGNYYLIEYPNDTQKQFTKMSLPHNINNIGFTIFFYKKNNNNNNQNSEFFFNTIIKKNSVLSQLMTCLLDKILTCVMCPQYDNDNDDPLIVSLLSSSKSTFLGHVANCIIDVLV